ncbi:acyl-CoA dehydrogenase family protein [Couchioplanes azureus]|uniref:acyl-CoA dehydrogenase family protein n=1 Tax=Couchioplanes caeruleus TaxID=56438 RepID=UPI001670C89C|nr:acyl-CoA dehydrogenase family protein [Couchioplanes caeruleus]GGQ72794.1 acyl-CoA dehydrogenase [Couchioplanes caeruleus subsp. azureus]
MDFSVSDEARELAALTRDLAASGRPLWPALAGAGVLAAALPKRAGGEGYGLPEQCAVLVELGRAAAAVPYLPSIVVAAGTLARFGTEEQVGRWAVPASRGEIVLTATTGTVTAERVEDGWRLDGTVPSVPAAPAAGLLLVPAAEGIFLVRPDDDGVTVEEQQVAGGPGAGLLRVAGTVVAGDRLLADPAARPWLAASATVGTCAAQLGVVERALEMTAEYARTRVQFERPIGAFQAVAQRLADAYIDVEALRVTLWQAAWRLCEHQSAAAEVATAGFWATEAGHRVAHTAVHVHGGVGIDADYPLHRYFLAAKYHEFLLGGATAQLLALGDTLRSPVERAGVFE